MRQDRGGRGRHEPPQNDGTRRAFGCLQMVANIGLLHQWETPFASSRKTTRQPTKKDGQRPIPLSRPKGERLKARGSMARGVPCPPQEPEKGMRPSTRPHPQAGAAKRAQKPQQPKGDDGTQKR